MTRVGWNRLRGWAGPAGLLGALLIAAPVLASDAQLQDRVRERLASAGLDQRGSVQVSVKDGVVTLEGFTLTLDARRDAEKAARKAAKRVENHLAVRPEPRPEREVKAAVVDAILGEPRYGVFDSVSVSLDDGVVLLQGSVLQPWLKDALESRVARVEGVRDISNQVRVAPSSIFDDRLRAELYRRIYGDDLFVRYSSWANPPIRIVVENGKVTLTGLVNDRVEQVKLGMIANGTLAFRVDNLVEVESERPKEPAKTKRS